MPLSIRSVHPETPPPTGVHTAVRRALRAIGPAPRDLPQLLLAVFAAKIAHDSGRTQAYRPHRRAEATAAAVREAHAAARDAWGTNVPDLPDDVRDGALHAASRAYDGADTARWPFACAHATLTELSPKTERQHLGQFFTPEPVAREAATMLGAGAGQHVLDPALGAGVLLAATCRGNGGDPVPCGIEIHAGALAAAKLLAAVTGLPADRLHGPGIDATDPEDDPSGRLADDPAAGAGFDGVIVNPPYGRIPGRKGMRQAHFADRTAGWLRPGGRAAMILPQGFLPKHLESRQGQALRDRITVIDTRAVAPDAFAPATRIQADIVLVERR